MVATTLVTVLLSHAFPRDPALQPLSFVFTFVPRPSLKILSRPIPPPPHARFPLWETSRLLSLPLVKSSNAVAIFGIPCPPPPSSWNKRRKADRKFPSLWIKVFSKLLSPPPPPPSSPAIFFYRSKLPPRGFEETEEGTLGRCFLYICRGVELTKEQVFGTKFCSTARSTGGRRSPGLTRLDIDFVKMPDRHHLYGRRVSGRGGREAWMIY